MHVMSRPPFSFTVLPGNAVTVFSIDSAGLGHHQSIQTSQNKTKKKESNFCLNKDDDKFGCAVLKGILSEGMLVGPINRNGI